MMLFKRLWARLTGGILVALQDHDGEVSIRVARQNLFGQLTAHRFSIYPRRSVILNPDGTCAGICYVVRWKEIS